EKPSVRESVESRIGRSHSNHAEKVLPVLLGGFESVARGSCVGKGACQLLRLAAIRSVPEDEYDFRALLRRQLDHDLERGAGIEPGARATRQGHAPERGRTPS